MDDILKTLNISAAGMRAQGSRLKVIAENLANANSLPQHAQDQPYRRRVVVFRDVLDRQLDVNTVKVQAVRTDPSPFVRRFEPAHPAADADGYVDAPNVKSLIEMADMREAERSYEANLSVIKTSRTMLFDTIDILR
ncbi:MAG: flagellar basal body rod protein FlgC [Rhodospirillales bacterium]|nr:flagellar basal body rod protein FlgC [Rhodospirillales bacterium]